MKTKKKKLPIHHRIHRHLKKHLTRLKKKRPHVHKALVLMSITLPLMLGALLFGSSALYMFESYWDNTDYSKEKISVNLPSAPDDTSHWKVYQDDLTGLSVKYPDRWDDPEVKKPNSGQKFFKYVSFDNGLGAANDQYKGFKIYVYDADKFSGPANTDNLTPRDPDNFKADNCDKAEFGEATVGEGDYPAQEVEITAENQCFQPAYFFSFTRSGYTFNILPEVGQGGNPISKENKSNIIAAFPKFFELISTLSITEKETPAKDEAPSPTRTVVKKAPVHRVLISLGRCAHKHDHPGYSKTKKHRHMDEDCCMDPDEWPNPRCQY
jgi:hypothetical protein